MKSTINKQELKDWIDSLDDQALLVTLQSIKNNISGKDFWDEISGAEKEAINRGKKQLDEGKGIPHEEVMKEVKERFLR